MRVVLKFGGTSLKTPKRIRQAAITAVKLWGGSNEIIVVVSAMGNETNRLLSIINQSTLKKAKTKDINKIVSIGEETSAKLLAATIRSLGGFSEAVYPSSPYWPIIADGKDDVPLATKKINEERDINILEEETQKFFRKRIKPLLKRKIIPVICGFLALNPKGEITTLGRGGSDITAFLTAKYLEADEVIIVTDVEGVLKGDPKLVKTTPPVKELTVEELTVLSSSGGQVIHPKALKYKSPQMTAKIVHYDHLLKLISTGTNIKGSWQTKTEVTAKKLALITILGKEMARLLGYLSNIVTTALSNEKIPVHSVSQSRHFVAIYLPQQYAQTAYKIIHQITNSNKRIKAVVLRENIGHIHLQSQSFIGTPGIIANISAGLASEGIGIISMITTQSDINIYVQHEHLDTSYKIITETL